MDKQVRDIMTADVLSVTPDKDLNFVEVLAEAKHVRHIVVTEDEKVVAVISVRDMLSHLSKASASHFVPAREVMSDRVVTIGPDATMVELATSMRECDISALPVVDAEQKLLGIVTERDFLKLFVED